MADEWLADDSVEDLRLVSSESFIDEDGRWNVCVYRISIDAVTFVDSEQEQRLRKRGVREIADLPEGPLA